MLESLQSSWLAAAVNESQLATASLSALHLLGFTLILGSALLCSLHLLGLLLPEHPTASIVRPATRVLTAGISVNIVTGLLLVLPRLSGAVANSTFRLKMLLLVAGVLLHALIVAPLGRRDRTAGVARRLAGLAGVAVWGGLAVAACAFILLE